MLAGVGPRVHAAMGHLVLLVVVLNLDALLLLLLLLNELGELLHLGLNLVLSQVVGQVFGAAPKSLKGLIGLGRGVHVAGLRGELLRAGLGGVRRALLSIAHIEHAQSRLDLLQILVLALSLGWL